MTPDRPVDDSPIAPSVTQSSPKRMPNGRAAITNRPQARIDGNSPAGRRIRDLYRALMKRPDNPADIVVQADVLALAELKVVAEAARLRLLEGTDKRSDECVRLENLVRRAEARVGLTPIGQAEEPAHPYGILFDVETTSGEQS
jgi:hypothetical protein